MNADDLNRGKREAPCFASADNLALDQLRLENLWLRQRLHALAKVEAEWRRRRTRQVDERLLAA